MGQSSSKNFTKLQFGHEQYQIDHEGKNKKNWGGQGNCLNRQKGDQTRGYFIKGAKEPILTGLIYQVRHACNQQSYAGFQYGAGQVCSGIITYAKDSGLSDVYCGTHTNRTLRVGFGQYKDRRKWEYIGFWKNQQMSGLGCLQNLVKNEKFLGWFENNQILGWGEYCRKQVNKVYQNEKVTKETTIWAEFAPNKKNDEQPDADGNTHEGNRVRNFKRIGADGEKKDGDEVESFTAFPRLEEEKIYTPGGRMMKYKIRLCLQLGKQVCSIERVGKRDYTVKNIGSHQTYDMDIDEVNQLALKQQFEEQLKEVANSMFDPDFNILNANFKILQVKTLTGMKGLYLLQSDIRQNQSLGKGRMGLGGDFGLDQRFFCKMHIFSSDKQIGVYRRELQLVRLAAEKNIGPPLSFIHENQKDIFLTYDNERLHKESSQDEISRSQGVIDEKAHLFKYVIMTKELNDGFFLDDLLGYRKEQPEIQLNPLARFLLIDKILQTYRVLQQNGVYHGQINPSHIFLDNLQDARRIDFSDIKLVDFSEAVKTKSSGSLHNDEQFRPTRFECALDCDDMQVEKKIKEKCFYLHKSYTFSKKFRYFHHPILHYLRIKHVDKPVDKLHFDIRDTQIYSLLIMFMIIVSPDQGIQEVMKNLMQNYTDDKFKNLDSRQKTDKEDEDGGSFNKRPLKMAEDFIIKAYNNHKNIQDAFKSFLDIIEVNLESSCEKYEKRRHVSKSSKKKKNKKQVEEEYEEEKKDERLLPGNPRNSRGLVAQNISELCKQLQPIVGKMIEEFKNIGGKYNPHRPTMAVIGGNKSGGAFKGGRTFAGRRTMMVEKKPQHQVKRDQIVNSSIFDKFFGQLWIGDVNQQNKRKIAAKAPPIHINSIAQEEEDDEDKFDDHQHGGVQDQMSKLSGRHDDRKNQLSLDRDLNSIKTSLQEKDDYAPYQVQQSSRRSKKAGKKYHELDGRATPEEIQISKHSRGNNKPNVNILGPNGDYKLNLQQQQEEQQFQLSARSQLSAQQEAMIDSVMKSKTPRNNNLDYDKDQSSRRMSISHGGRYKNTNLSVFDKEEDDDIDDDNDSDTYKTDEDEDF